MTIPGVGTVRDAGEIWFLSLALTFVSFICDPDIDMRHNVYFDPYVIFGPPILTIAISSLLSAYTTRYKRIPPTLPPTQDEDITARSQETDENDQVEVAKQLAGAKSVRFQLWSLSRSSILYLSSLCLCPPVLAAPVQPLGNTAVSSTSRVNPMKSESKPTVLILTNVLKVMVAVFACTILTVAARYCRQTWKLLAPVMGTSSVAFAILKDGDTSESELLSMMALAVWSIATTSYVWTAKYMVPAGRYNLYILAFSFTTGICTFMFAERLQERPLAVVPPCAAVCAFVCKKCLQLNFEHYGTIEGLGADWHVNNSPTHGERDMAAASDRRHRPLRSTQEPITQMSVDAAS